MSRVIVLAVDPTSDLSAPLVRWTCQNILRPNDLLHLITGWSLDPEYDAQDLSSDYMYVGAMLAEQELETAQKYMQQLETYSELAKEELNGMQVEVRASLLKGRVSAGDQITEFVQDTKAAMLVLASRDLSALKRFWSGSFSDFCVHHVACPVVVVKHVELLAQPNNEVQGKELEAA
jgi:nucleotide-binding universal stress UspA family protein